MPVCSLVILCFHFLLLPSYNQLWLTNRIIIKTWMRIGNPVWSTSHHSLVFKYWILSLIQMLWWLTVGFIIWCMIWLPSRWTQECGSWMKSYVEASSFSCYFLWLPPLKTLFFISFIFTLLLSSISNICGALTFSLFSFMKSYSANKWKTNRLSTCSWLAVESYYEWKEDNYLCKDYWLLVVFYLEPDVSSSVSTSEMLLCYGAHSLCLILLGAPLGILSRSYTSASTSYFICYFLLCFGITFMSH